jgi:hypothetical protein
VAAFQERETFALPGVALRPVGAEGGPTGMVCASAELELSPLALTALTT